MTAAVLAAAAARRLVLRRGLGALAALFVSVPAPRHRSQMPRELDNVVGYADQQYGVPVSSGTSQPSESEQKGRRNAAREVELKRDKMWRDKQIDHESWFNQDPNLLVLGSTSQAWRASVMKTRMKRTESLVDEMDRRIRAIWEEPFAAVERMVAGWLRGEP